MAKKAVKIYLADKDVLWAEQYPIRDTVSGSVSLITDWAFREVQRGQITALEKLDKKELWAIVKYSKSITMTVEMSPETVSTGLLDWFRFGQKLEQKLDMNMGKGWENPQISRLIEKIRDMTPAEVIGLLCWTRTQ